ncbi:YesL family protein [Lapidilactobacillus mulanensis]|uniref:YesL family protein n=1 Tax=Lapidilactobacillus mulanensis TaxID=2485999 RepID=A0ABW4DUA3_9LACO|nr:DUF624 domain-containing protein [Lapidilactobacillus mulanensis]
MTIEKIAKLNGYMIGIFKIIYLNILWLVFSILGLGIFGIGPAFYALNKYLDQWLRLKREIPITKNFCHYFFERFWQSVAISAIYAGLFLIVIVNLFYLKNSYLRIVNLIFLFFVLIACTHVYKVMVSTNFNKVYEVIRGAFLLGFGYLFQTVIAWLVVIGVYLLISKFVPVLLAIFGMGFVVFILSLDGNLIIKNLYHKQLV